MKTPYALSIVLASSLLSACGADPAANAAQQAVQASIDARIAYCGCKEVFDETVAADCEAEPERAAWSDETARCFEDAVSRYPDELEPYFGCVRDANEAAARCWSDNAACETSTITDCFDALEAAIASCEAPEGEARDALGECL